MLIFFLLFVYLYEVERRHLRLTFYEKSREEHRNLTICMKSRLGLVKRQNARAKIYKTVGIVTSYMVTVRIHGVFNKNCNVQN